jgi:hypothetical protein
VGDVAIFSNGAWTVTGGPRAVESPARLSWPCGAYSLTARSRADPGETRSATLTVQPKRQAVFDLR